ncbi:hypothetical protein RclHR1_09490003 [Rhizophagus clarus]|uniref:Sel1 repeat family protein n=1 Tax=Rhizophagus clarus TaxID=94130 RepID=A0A2Z6SIL3_9GLOM|nr:hypothetical protein RclHR1_09490003 [Rhizophagus clarus]GES93910.1 Sel1 repeat family protein [Rhizophagus clarus]
MTDKILTESKNDNILTEPKNNDTLKNENTLIRNQRVSIVLSSTSSETLSIDTLSLDAQSFKSISSKSPSTINLTFSPTEENFPSSLTPNNKKKKNILITIKDKIPNPTDILRNVKKDIRNFITKDKQRRKETDFLGYYQCINTSELLNSKISLSTARINLHEGESVDEAKRIVITNIQNSPYIENVSLFIIPGKGNHMNSSNVPGILNKSFLDWMNDSSIKNLVDGEPIKGEGTYEVFIKRIHDDENNNNFYEVKDKVLKEWEKNAKNSKDIKHKMALAGYYMKGPKEKYFEAESWYKKAEKLGSMEAKLCLGYMHSIGKLRFDPKRSKELFKGVISKLEKSNKDKDKKLCRIAMRNMALVYHNSHFIKPFEWDNLTKISKLSDLKVKKLSKVKLKIAIKWYMKSSNLGDSQSAYNLGLLYESDDNNGTRKDIYQAEIYFRKAVEYDNNNLYAKAKLGRLLINKKDANEKEKGFKMLEETANLGLVMSQTYLGEYYEKEGNFEEAIKFYFKAAKQRRGRYSHIAQYHFKELSKDILESYERDKDYGYINCEEKLKDIY